MQAAIAAVKQHYAPLRNPYLVALVDGTMSRDDFIETQIQFLFAVAFFSRPMATLAGRLPQPAMRLPLLENIRDEHGSGCLSGAHENTFLELLARLGVDRPSVASRALWPEVRAFNTTLSGVCALDDALTALAAIAIIEDLFSGISACIGDAIVARGFLNAEHIVHYATHETLDVKHAETLYAGLVEPYARDPLARYQIDQGLQLGTYSFLTMYEGLYRARQRRWTRDVAGPHSLSDGWHVELG